MTIQKCPKDHFKILSHFARCQGVLSLKIIENRNIWIDSIVIPLIPRELLSKLKRKKHISLEKIDKLGVEVIEQKLGGIRTKITIKQHGKIIAEKEFNEFKNI